MPNAGHSFLVLVHTVLVGCNPNCSYLVEEQLTGRVLRDARLVVFVVQELAHLTVFEIYDKEAFVVGSHP